VCLEQFAGYEEASGRRVKDLFSCWFLLIWSAWTASLSQFGDWNNERSWRKPAIPEKRSGCSESNNTEGILGVNTRATGDWVRKMKWGAALRLKNFMFAAVPEAPVHDTIKNINRRSGQKILSSWKSLGQCD
jgi:hypothetical protein